MFAIPEYQLSQMMQHFEYSLGDLGFAVFPEEMEKWQQTWDRVFGSDGNNQPSPPKVDDDDESSSKPSPSATMPLYGDGTGVSDNEVHKPSPGFFTPQQQYAAATQTPPVSEASTHYMHSDPPHQQQRTDETSTPTTSRHSRGFSTPPAFHSHNKVPV